MTGVRGYVISDVYQFPVKMYIDMMLAARYYSSCDALLISAAFWLVARCKPYKFVHYFWLRVVDKKEKERGRGFTSNNV